MKSTRKKAVPKRPKPARSATRAAWARRAEKLLDAAFERAQKLPALKKRAPAAHWTVEIEIVGLASMRRLNLETRGKDQPTDVLSFELPASFRAQGLLGQLVVCLPVLKAQARALKHSQARELEVLIVHGLLHLLGFDHEKGPKAAREMAAFEGKILGEAKGLIGR